MSITALSACCPWQHPELTAVNRLPGRATCWPYPDAAAAQEDRRMQRRCLDGQWRFSLFPQVEATPQECLEPDFDDRSWAHLPVPGLWTMHGFDRPHYTNWRLPFTPVDSPHVPQDNPTGIYRHTFALPQSWAKRRVVLHFAGIEASCISLWVNGQAIGMAKDCRVACEFDMSAAVHAGDNTLVLQCIKFGDSNYVEDQDHWRQNGIHRSVYIYATGPAFIEDCACRGDYDPSTGSGTLDAELRLGGAGGPGWQARMQLLDPRGKPVWKRARQAEVPWGLTAHNAPREPIASLSCALKRVRPWSHEDPALYTVIVELIDPQGRCVEATRLRMGFRNVSIADKQLLINGRMVFIKGVNRHDHHAITGKVLDRASMEEDLRVMKAHHINAIRCSHYPNDPLFLDLCDEHGFLVIDEANIETHHTYARTAHDPRFAAAFLDRGMRMVLRDRNHPSIIAWSLGNESGYGPNHDAMAGWISHVDPSRPLHYEGAICRANSDWDRGHTATDIICPMYPSVQDLVDWAETNEDWRPLILSEYSHAMGNSNGSLADYWQAIRAHHGLQGGFIWEWIDHGLLRQKSDGESYYAYGGDFDDHPNDADFVCDGLVWPDRTPHPAMQEVARLFQPLQGEVVDPEGVVRIYSEYAFTDTRHLRGRYSILCDGVVIASGALPRLRIPAGGSQLLSWKGMPAELAGDEAVREIMSALPSVPRGCEVHLRLHWQDSRKDTLLGGDQPSICLQWPMLTPSHAPVSAPERPQQNLQSQRSGQRIDVVGEWTRLVINAKDCSLYWQHRGQTLIDGPMLSTLWRAPIQNDGIRSKHYHAEPAPKGEHLKPLRRWCMQGLDCLQGHHRLQGVETDAQGGIVITIVSQYRGLRTAPSLREQRQITMHADGSCSCEHHYQLPSAWDDPPRLGLAYHLATGLEAMEWFGHGPGESYRDRCLGSPEGRYQDSVRQRYVPYIMPQEHGNIMGLRWLALRNEQGRGLLVRAQGLIEGKASFLSDAVVSAARHTTDLSWSSSPILSLDVAQRGLGTGSCGPETLPEYRISAGEHHLRYRLIPLHEKDNPGELF
ncbi:MAG: beta-galactosidase [Planctomycetota bacterium]|nr:MAG: beta-galactosidase [Planctomycetota bacterium]